MTKEEIRNKLKINQKIIEFFNEINYTCVKDMLSLLNKKEMSEKYSLVCSKSNDNCDKCWTQFILEDLIEIED